MEISLGFLCTMLVASVTPVSAAELPGVIEDLLLATVKRPWLWGVYVVVVGLPIILFISFMWPNKRFGPPGEQYYYKKDDEDQADDPELAPRKQSAGVKGKSDRGGARRRDTQSKQKKSDLELKAN